MRVCSIFLDSPSELLRPALLAELGAAGMAASEVDTCEDGPVVAVLDRIGSMDQVTPDLEGKIVA